MPISELASGTFEPESAGTSWEDLHGGTPDTTAAVVQVFVDLAALAAGDTVDFQLLEACRSGGTPRVVWTSSAAGPADDIIASPSLIVMHGWTLRARQTSGTVRSFPWSIRAVT